MTHPSSWCLLLAVAYLNLLICLIWKEAFLSSKLDAELNSKDTRKVEFRLREQIWGFSSFSCSSSYVDVCPACAWGIPHQPMKTFRILCYPHNEKSLALGPTWPSLSLIGGKHWEYTGVPTPPHTLPEQSKDWDPQGASCKRGQREDGTQKYRMKQEATDM